MITEETKTTKSQTEKDWVLCFNTTQKMVIDHVMSTINHFIKCEKGWMKMRKNDLDGLEKGIQLGFLPQEKLDKEKEKVLIENKECEHGISTLKKLKETMEYSLEDLTCNTFYHYPYDDIDWDND